MMRPTQPIMPPRHTAAALRRVEARISYQAEPAHVDAQRDGLLLLQGQQIDPPAQQQDDGETHRHGDGASGEGAHAGLGQIPMSQNVICWSTSLGSETYLIMVTPALHRAMTMEPVSTRLSYWNGPICG